jgi:chemotaxis family two-component system response regulator Rcp1
MYSMINSRPYILYVEDDVEDVELLRYTLDETPFAFGITHITNGPEALDFLERCKQYNRFPEMIFLDINLSKINGKEVLICLKADKDIARIPVTVLSTSTLESDIAYFRKYHIPYIVKPGDVRKFKDEVSEVMKGLLAFDYDLSLEL